jgi:hypothetical protein
MEWSSIERRSSAEAADMTALAVTMRATKRARFTTCPTFGLSHRLLTEIIVLSPYHRETNAHDKQKAPDIER